jgi:hypothetical protein
MTKTHTTTTPPRRSTRRSQRTPWLLARIAVAACLLMLLIPAASVFALPADGGGNYTQILCADPASEEGLGISGMPEGLTNPASIATWQVATSEVNCSSGHMLPGRGVPMAVGQGNTYAQGTWSALLYQAPAGVTINGGSIYRAEKAEGEHNGFMGIIQQGGEDNVLYSLPRNPVDQGDWYVGNVASRGTFAWPFSPENLVNLTVSPDASHWDVNATCDPDGNNNSSCTLVTDQWEYRIFGGEVSLNAVNDPEASNIAGPLTSETPLRGGESITFSATDQGPGLAYVKLLVDGQSVQSQIIDTNDGHCIPVPGHDAYTWAYQIPCKTSVGGRTYELDTGALPDGTHHVQVIIEDAAGNQSVVLDRTVASDNAPANTSAPAIIAQGTLQAGTALSGQPGAWSAPAGAGAISYAYQWQDCDPEGNNCQAIPGAQAPGYTPAASDIGHTLRLLLTASDNDGAASTPSPASSVVIAAPAGSGTSPGTPAGGTPNGTNASESAALRLNGAPAISRPFAQRAFNLTGQLSTSRGTPISGATLEVLQQITGTSTLTLIGHATTNSSGVFTVSIPAGPSRRIEIAYRANTADSSYTTSASVTETVKAGIQLHVSATSTGPNGRVIFSGHVYGPIPRQGALIQLLVHYHGHWELLRNPHTTRNGTFKVIYQFEDAIGRFPFAAEVPSGQANFPYTTGHSNTVNVNTA